MNSYPEMIPLAVVGCDFRVASSAWRSRLVLTDEDFHVISEGLFEGQAADGFLELNTCNRNEWIVSSRNPEWAASLLQGQMMLRLGQEARARFSPYIHTGEDAARHVFRVATGRESLVYGERQIAGQLNDAIEKARIRKSSSRILNGLGTACGRLVKLALREGCMGDAGIGVHSLAVDFLKNHLTKGRTAQVAVAGQGQIGRKVLGLLERDGHMQAVPFNRTISHGQERKVRPLNDLLSALEEMDGLILCTGAPCPILKTGELPPRSADHPLWIVDIGIPEQAERRPLPANVHIGGLDDLTSFHHRKNPQQEKKRIENAEQWIEKAMDEFKTFCRQEVFTEIIRSMHESHSRMLREDIPRVLDQRLAGIPEEVRIQLEQELRAVFSDHTRNLFRSIREASGKSEETVCRKKD